MSEMADYTLEEVYNYEDAVMDYTEQPIDKKDARLEKYRKTMTLEVLHSWATDAQKELDRLRRLEAKGEK